MRQLPPNLLKQITGGGMCTAQVLLLSRDVLMRRCNNTPRGVRRKLFASADPSGPTEALKRMQEQIRKRDAERWNFDFFTETPLPGRYQWVPVGGESSCSGKQTTEEASESNPESRLRQAEPIVEEIQRVSAPTQSKRKKDAGVTSQKKITDFMTKRKRLSTGESSSKLKKSKTSHSESVASMARLA